MLTVLYLLRKLGRLASYAVPHGSATHSAQSLQEVQVQSKPLNWCSRKKRTRSWTQPVAFPQCASNNPPVGPLPIDTSTGLGVERTALPSSRRTSLFTSASLYPPSLLTHLSGTDTGQLYLIKWPVSVGCDSAQAHWHLLISHFKHCHCHDQDQVQDCKYFNDFSRTCSFGLISLWRSVYWHHCKHFFCGKASKSTNHSLIYFR